MKHFAVVFLMILTLAGCSANNTGMEQALALREALLNGDGCSFRTAITADYEDSVYSFEMECTADKEGNLSFEVIKPDSISGIKGEINHKEGKLTFDDQALLFQAFADDQVTPVSAPWVMLYSLRSGYIQGCGKYQDGLHIQIDDSYEDKTLTVEYYTDANHIPIRAEIIWQGRRIVSMDVENFTIL